MSFYDDIPRYDYKPGDTFKAIINFSSEPVKCHVMYVLDGYYAHSELDNGTRPEKLIVFRVYGKHRQWWHQFMEREMEMNIHRYDFEKYCSNNNS